MAWAGSPDCPPGFITSREAGKRFGFGNDYISFLCRRSKVRGVLAGRQWLVDEASLAAFVKATAEERQHQAQQMSQARREEYRAARSLRRRTTTIFAAPRSMPALNLTKHAVASHALALLVAFAAVASGALLARAAVIPLATNIGSLVSEVSVGFGEMIADVPSRIASHVSKAQGDVAPARARVVRDITRATTTRPIPLALVTPGLSSAPLVPSSPAGGSPAEGPQVPVSAAITLVDLQAAVSDGLSALQSPDKLLTTIADAYRSIGTIGYDAIQGARDALAATPATLMRSDIALGEFVIGGTHAAIGADMALAYAVPTVAPLLSRAAVISIDDLGAATVRVALAVPDAAISALRTIRAAGAHGNLAAAVSLSSAWDAWTSWLALTLYPAPPLVASTPLSTRRSPTLSSGASSSSGGIGNTGNNSTTVINKTVYEYLPATTSPAITVSGISKAVLDQSLASLRLDIIGDIGNIGPPHQSESLSGTTITNGASIAATTGSFDSLTGGATSLATTTITGDLSISGNSTIGGTLTAGTLSVSGVSSGGAISAPYFTATSSTAASVFNGGLVGMSSTTLQTLTFTIATGTSATTTNFFASTASSTNLFAQNATLGALTASSLTLNSPLLVASGGTGATSFGQGWLYSSGGSTAFAASTSPTVNYLTATSTTVASQFPYASTTALTVSGNSFLTGLATLGNGLISQASSTVVGNFTTTGTNAFGGDLIVAGNTTLTSATTSSLFIKQALAASSAAFGATATSSFSTAGALTLASALTIQNGGTGTTTWQTNSIPYYNGSIFTENNPLFNFNGTKLTASYASSTALSVGSGLYNTYLTSGRVPYSTSSGLLTDSSNLTFNGTTLTANTLTLTNPLTVGSGGTGWAAIQASAIPYGAGSGALSTTTAGTAGYVLSYLSGIPAWTATTTFSSPLLYSGGNVTCQTADSSHAGCLTSGDWGTFNNKVSSTSLSAAFPLAYNSSTGAFAYNGLGTSTAAVIGNLPYFSGANTFANVATSSLALGTGLNLSAGSLGYQIGGSAATIKLADTAVTPASYGSSTAIPTFIVDQQGRLTAASTAAVIAPAGTLTGTTLASNVVSSSLTSISTLSAGAVPASLVTAGTFGIGNYIFNGNASSTELGSTGGAYFATSGGLVGIGTTAPSAQLEVYGSGQLTAALTNAGEHGGTLALNSSNLAAGEGGAITFGSYQSKASGSIGFAGIKGLLTDGTSNTIGDLAFSTRNTAGDTALTERMRILGNGNVGIGTTTPGSLFSVGGAASIGTDYGVAAPTNGLIVEGNVGIGTTGPLSKLDVNGGLAVGTYAGANAAPSNGMIVSGNVGIGTTNPQNALSVNGIIETTNSDLAFNRYYSGGWKYDTTGPTALIAPFATNGGTLQFYVAASGTAGTAITDTSPMTLSAANGGSVGIGTTNPGYLLDVQKTGGASPSVAVLNISQTSTNGSGTDSNALIRFSGSNGYNGRTWFAGMGSNTYFGAHDNFGIYDSTAGAARLVINGSGNLGIGTTTVIGKLDVQEGTNRVLSFRDPNSFGGLSTAVTLEAFNSNATALIPFTLEGSPLVLNDLGGGNVGIGTTSPALALDINGAGSNRINGLSNMQLFAGLPDQSGFGGVVLGSGINGNSPSIAASKDSNGNPLNLSFITNGTVREYIDTLGNLTPGASNSYNLGSAGINWGCLYYNNTTLGSCASDARLKTNIQDLSFDTATSTALAQVEGLRLRTFNFLTAPTSTPYEGFIAQEVLPVAPELVTKGSDGYYRVNYGSVQYLMLQAMQEIASVSGAFKANLIAWLGSASNGINDFFANNIYGDNVYVQNQLCIADSTGAKTCITKAQLDALLASAGAAGQGGSSGATASAATTTSATDAPSCTLAASPEVVALGDHVVLSWTTTNAATFSLDQGIGAVSPALAGTTTTKAILANTTFTGTTVSATGTLTTCTAAVSLSPIVIQDVPSASSPAPDTAPSTTATPPVLVASTSPPSPTAATTPTTASTTVTSAGQGTAASTNTTAPSDTGAGTPSADTSTAPTSPATPDATATP